MKTKYKIIIACTVTAILTAFVTAVATVKIVDWQYSSGEMQCKDGANPDGNGCCPGETYTDMGSEGFNCCPNDGGDCFPPIK